MGARVLFHVKLYDRLLFGDDDAGLAARRGHTPPFVSPACYAGSSLTSLWGEPPSRRYEE